MSAQPTATAKTCAGCGRTLPPRLFYRRAASPDGRQRVCIACDRAARGHRPRPFRGPNARGEWRCGVCDRWLPRDGYTANRSRRQTRAAPRPICRDCQRAAARAKRRAAKADPAALAAERRRKARFAAARHGRTHEERAWRARWMAATVAALLAAGWTRTTLARAWGVDRDTLRAWERGTAVPQARSMEAVLAWQRAGGAKA